MRAPGVLLLLLLAANSIDGASYKVTTPTEWWQTTVFYQVWVRSFKDSNGDGIGDLKGVTSKMEHFYDMGVGAIWLSPFYNSSMYDTGYDVSNFTAVYGEYGTLEDFDELVAIAHKFGIKVILDFVPNHTSDEHEWFVKSKAGIEPYKDYYIWSKGVLDANGTRQPPNNWLTATNVGSSWKWVEERGAYYFHQFYSKQVDLNYRNPLVIQEMKNIITFWLDHGADGFRVDSANYVIEDAMLRNESLSGLEGYSSTDFYYLNNFYVKDQAQDYEIVQMWRDHIDDYLKTKGENTAIPLLTEAYANVSSVMKYYDSGSDVPFNFVLMKDDEGISVVTFDTAEEVVGNITQWMKNLPEGATSNLVFSNHDNSRVATRYGSQYVDGVNFMLYLLPGVATTYNGEELGMVDTYLTWNETQDAAACDTDPEDYDSVSRDPERTPYQWDNTTSAGFSTNSTTELPVNQNYLTLNLAAQKEANVSHYKNVQAAIKLRENLVVKEGSLNVEAIDNVVAFTRELENEQPIVVLINWGNTTQTISLEVFKNVPDKLKVLIADVNSGITVGDQFEKDSVKLPAYAAVVLEGIQSENVLQTIASGVISKLFSWG